jgi:hypothetical protein
MDQSAPKPNFTKPIGGFIVVLAVALLVGGWLYVDMVKNELEQKVDSLSTELEASKARERERAATEPAPSAQDEVVWQTYSAELDGRRFQIDLPPGTKLSVGASVNELAYVLPDPVTDDNSLPYMSIRIASISEKKDFANEGGVIVEAGDRLFWLSLWEDMEWTPFERVAASFKPL